MDKKNLEKDPELLELIVSFDWASPTTAECSAFDISDNLHARICFRPDNEVWIIDKRELRVMYCDEQVSEFWGLQYLYQQDNNNPVPRQRG